MKKNLKNTKVIIAAHIFATGPALDLEEYLQDKVKSLLFIGHPFAFREDKDSFCRYYQRGELVKKITGPGAKLPTFLFYLRDAFYTFWWAARLKEEVDLFIGSDNFLAFVGLILKKIGKVRRVVLYTIDFVPQRFTNPLLNWLYHFFDRACLKNCDLVWNVSPQIATARQELRGIGGRGFTKQITVPLGMWYQRIPQLPFNQRKRFQIVFLGHLLAKQGLQVVIRALPLVLAKLPQVELVIIGDGVYKNQLINLARKMSVSQRVKFLGFLKDHREVERILAQSALAVATYKPDPESFTYFADPGKIKTYLGAGLPVVVTDVPAVTRQLVKKQCGILCQYSPNSIAVAIIDLLGSREKVTKYSQNAREFGREFDWEKIFKRALVTTLKVENESSDL